MSMRSHSRAIEKTLIRPLFKKVKAVLPFFKRSDTDHTFRDPRIDELERRLDELEKLVREDLGLRYMNLSRDDPSKARLG